jgi:hypothetical protein
MKRPRDRACRVYKCLTKCRLQYVAVQKSRDHEMFRYCRNSSWHVMDVLCSSFPPSYHIQVLSPQHPTSNVQNREAPAPLLSGPRSPCRRSFPVNASSYLSLIGNSATYTQFQLRCHSVSGTLLCIRLHEHIGRIQGLCFIPCSSYGRQVLCYHTHCLRPMHLHAYGRALDAVRYLSGPDMANERLITGAIPALSFLAAFIQSLLYQP